MGVLSMASRIVPTSIDSKKANPNSSPLKTHRLSLSPWTHRIMWVIVILVFFLNGLLAAAFALIYTAALVIRNGAMIATAGLLPQQYIPIVIAAYVCIAGYFFMAVARALYASVRSRRFSFSLPPMAQPQPPQQPTSTCPPPSSPWRLVRTWRWTTTTLQKGFSILKSSTPYKFEVLFLSREVSEVATQSYQAYKCSTLISQAWINQFYTAILAINCWIAPLIHFAAKRDAVAQRFLFLWSDVILDFLSTLVIPVAIIFFDLLVMFADNSQSEATDAEYAFDAPYTDTFLVNMFKGAQQICVVSWWDFVTKMLPFVSMATCLKYIAQMMDHQRDMELLSASIASIQTVQVASSSSTSAQNKTSGRASWKGCRPPRWLKWVMSSHAVYILFFAWGAAIVAFHLQAQAVSHATPTALKMGCKSSSKPWLVSKFSCSVLEINCYRRGISGSVEELDHVLGLVDAHGMSSLILSHCTALEMPPRIQTLSNLMGLEVVNSTIVSWAEDASLTNAKTPSLLFLTLTRVNMSTLPMGLQHYDFPQHLTDIGISVSNLTTLPDDLHLKWRSVTNLLLERTSIEFVPATVGKMKLDRLSLFGNQIRSIPDNLLAVGEFTVLSVAKNPIDQVPLLTPASAQALNMVLLDYTEIAQLPQWLIEEGKRRNDAKQASITISTGGSPYCGNYSSVSPPPLTFGLLIVCRLKPNEAIEGYPLSFNMAHRVP